MLTTILLGLVPRTGHRIASINVPQSSQFVGGIEYVHARVAPLADTHIVRLALWRFNIAWGETA